MSQREFLPAAGRDVFLPLYDPIVSLMGFDSALNDPFGGRASAKYPRNDERKYN